MRRLGRTQALRGVVAGALTTFLALLFHVVGGGTVPNALALSIALAAVCWVAILIGRCRASLPLLLVSIGVAQVLLHTVFSMASADVALSAEHHGGHGALIVVGLGGGHAMWFAHLLAGVVTVAALRRGEPALRQLLELARVVAATLVGTVIGLLEIGARPTSDPLAAHGPERDVAGTVRTLATTVQRRGPPALVA